MSHLIFPPIIIRSLHIMQKLVNLRQNPATFFVLILLPMCVIIAYEVFAIYKKSTAEKDGKASDNEEKK